MAVASLVLGIVSIVIGVLFSVWGWLGAILGIIGIVLAVMVRRQETGNGIAMAGLVCSIIGTVLSLLTYILCVACISALAS